MKSNENVRDVSNEIAWFIKKWNEWTVHSCWSLHSFFFSSFLNSSTFNIVAVLESNHWCRERNSNFNFLNALLIEIWKEPFCIIVFNCTFLEHLFVDILRKVVKKKDRSLYQKLFSLQKRPLQKNCSHSIVYIFLSWDKLAVSANNCCLNETVPYLKLGSVLKEKLFLHWNLTKKKGRFLRPFC